MAGGFNQKINFSADLTGRVSNTGFDLKPSMDIGSLNESEGPTFKGVMSNLVQNLNHEMNAPDQLLKDSMAGNQDVDIHDVMTAMAKAELSVSVATQITSKVIQAYDKIMQISV